jgi:SagB-type dehydrogenase family enzyme
MTDTDGIEPWEAFWLASELSPSTSPGFGTRIGEFAPAAANHNRFMFAAAGEPLLHELDHLDRLLAARRSVREFRDGVMSAAELGAIFGAFRDPRGTPDETRRRAWPSAGGLYPLEVFGLLLAVDHNLNGKAVHYECDTHELTPIAQAPPWLDLTSSLAADVVVGEPQVVVLFVLDTEVAERKYGSRAGRFALIEVGHAAQNLALRLAASGLGGCELGGSQDRPILTMLGLGHTRARLALAYACGLPSCAASATGSRSGSRFRAMVGRTRFGKR